MALTAARVFEIDRARLLKLGRQSPEFLVSTFRQPGQEVESLDTALALDTTALWALESRDFDDAILNTDRLALDIGDVCGKQLPASMFMASSRQSCARPRASRSSPGRPRLVHQRRHRGNQPREGGKRRSFPARYPVEVPRGTTATLVAGIIEAVDSFAQGADQAGDITCVVVSRLRDPDPSAGSRCLSYHILPVPGLRSVVTRWAMGRHVRQAAGLAFTFV